MTNISKEERKNWIGASESAALFGVSPFTTYFELWHQKAGNLPAPDLDGNERVFWGTVLENAVAQGITEREGLTIRNVRRYVAHKSVPKMGASLDFEIVNHPDGPGVLEIKTVDGITFKNWPELADGSKEPPLHYLLQLQHQLACIGRKWGMIGVLVGGNDCHIYRYERHDGVIAKIEKAVTDFWASIDAGKEPKPDYAVDADAIMKLSMSVDNDKAIDMTEDNYLMDLCARYRDVASQASDLDKQKKAIKAEIIEKIGDAAKVTAGPYTISAKMTPEKEMHFTRPAFRNFRLTERKQK